MTIEIKNNPYNRNIAELSKVAVYYEEYGETTVTLPTEGLTGITYEVIG